MGDVSVFMRELKTRASLFGITRNTGRWALSGRSVSAVWWWKRIPEAQRMVAAYIDLNPVRAGLVEDAADYGFSGFGEACAGGSAARDRRGE